MEKCGRQRIIYFVPLIMPNDFAVFGFCENSLIADRYGEHNNLVFNK